MRGTEPVEDHPYISPEMIIQRPKVVYSEGSGLYHVSAPELSPRYRKPSSVRYSPVL